MEKLSVTLNTVLNHLHSKAKNKLPILKVLNKHLTKRELKHITYISLFKDTLRIGVDSSGWLYCLHQKKQPLLEELKLKEIKFYLK